MSATALLGVGCDAVLPPLRGQLDVGHDAYAVFVAGDPRSSDLYVLDAAGGGVIQLTYTAVAELAPAIPSAEAGTATLGPLGGAATTCSGRDVLRWAPDCSALS